MKERINWIDWAKALAVCTVVFCHLPQSQEWFYYRYLQSVIIVVFFFISGYLKKDYGSTKANWQKYWRGLILPYILYNVIVYPYWLIKYYMQHGVMPDLFSAVKPIIGAILFQHENSFCEPLNGPLWYLPAILIMHITIDLCRKTKYQHHIMIALCVASVVLYASNKYYLFLPNLTPMGLFRRLPYYYIGYVMGQKCRFREVNTKRDAIRCILLITLSLLIFQWHLLEKNFIIHISLFYPVNFCFMFGMLYACKAINSIKSMVVQNISIGTLVVIGLHVPIISLMNLCIKTIFYSSQHHIFYHWYTALPTTFIICSLLYPTIFWGVKSMPFIFGK